MHILECCDILLPRQVAESATVHLYPLRGLLLMVAYNLTYGFTTVFTETLLTNDVSLYVVFCMVRILFLSLTD